MANSSGRLPDDIEKVVSRLEAIDAYVQKRATSATLCPERSSLTTKLLYSPTSLLAASSILQWLAGRLG